MEVYKALTLGRGVGHVIVGYAVIRMLWLLHPCAVVDVGCLYMGHDKGISFPLYYICVLLLLK